ncbi:CBO0543 family protein [Rossellomorea aquimaris]|nr:CBO0543 family protein [Rossellomorea aquimaris]WRP07218.1 CBO0543 family protein [Rossellomorea aquimaris]
MTESQQTMLSRLKEIQENQTEMWTSYWQQYSDFATWPFWVLAALFILPLIVLFFVLDKRKALLLGFYGYNVHVFFTYVDAIGANLVKWFYPYKIFPVLASSISLDVSLVPVAFMLMYQFTLNHHKNYYLFMFLLSAVFAFAFKPLLVAIGLFEMSEGTNYFTLFLCYVVVGLIAKWITDVFVYFEKKALNRV